MLQQDQPDDYVLATGRTSSVRDFLETCLNDMGVPFERAGAGEQEHYLDRRTGRKIVAVDPAYYRPAEVDLLLGSPAKAERQLGWRARTTVEELASLMLKADCRLLNVEPGRP